MRTLSKARLDKNHTRHAPPVMPLEVAFLVPEA
jgi:hypothetical protein